MTNWATLRFICLFFLLLPGDGHELCSRIRVWTRSIRANDVRVFIVREVDLELGNKLPPLTFRVRNIAEARKEISTGISRAVLDVAV